MRKGLRKLGGICLMLFAVAALSSCAARAGRSPYQTKLPPVQGVKTLDCTLTGPDGTPVKSQCVILPAADMAAILTEYVKACVALGNKVQDCGVRITK